MIEDSIGPVLKPMVKKPANVNALVSNRLAVHPGAPFDLNPEQARAAASFLAEPVLKPVSRRDGKEKNTPDRSVNNSIHPYIWPNY